MRIGQIVQVEALKSDITEEWNVNDSKRGRVEEEIDCIFYFLSKEVCCGVTENSNY